MKTFLGVTAGLVLLLLSLVPARGGPPSTTLESAIRAVEEGRYTEALSQLEGLPAASLSPMERKRARYLSGHVYLKLKRYPEALQAFGESLDLYPELGDYAIWNVARIYKELHAERVRLETLRLLLTRFPQSRLAPQARMALVRDLIGVTGDITEGVRLLEEFLSQQGHEPYISEVHLLLGQGYEALGLRQKAIDAYRTLYVRYPASPEAGRAAGRIEVMLPRELRFPASLSPSERLDRADHLGEAGECERAIDEVRRLPTDTLSGDLAARATARLGLCAFKLRRYREAAATLDKFRQAFFADARAAEALYTTAVAYQRDGQAAEAERTFRQLAARDPLTPWNAKALVALGQMYEARQDIARAIDAYTQLATRFQADDRADEMAWRMGWLRYGRQLFSAAARDFATAAERFPLSMFASNALYWQAKALEKSGSYAQALALYERVARDYPYTYYGVRAEEVRLSGASLSSTAGTSISPAKLLAADHETANLAATDPTLSPPAAFHRVRADELLALHLLDDAREEVAQLAKRVGVGLSEQLLLAHLYLSVGMTLPAIRTLNASLREVNPSERLTLPTQFWTLLFPRLYWEEVQDGAKHSQLDPLLILGVVRQESAFNPRAISRSDARGLMQLLPSTGREVFQRSGMGAFQSDILFDPRVNVRLGSQYLGRLANAHQGNLILMLAAYNAGPTRVKRWLQEMSIADWDEFVESLPFEETRGYVKNVLRNYGIYRQLYASGREGTADERR